jgi:hypothetical protein
MHSGGNTSGGGFGCGAQPIRFSAPAPRPPNWPCCVGVIVLPLPFATAEISFLPSCAHRLPPPDWQPNGCGPLLNALSSAWPSIMSLTFVSSGARISRLSSELSRVSVNTPAEPPFTVHVPGVSGGRSKPPCRRTFGLFGKFVRPSANVW